MATPSIWGKHQLMLLMIGISAVTPICMDVDTIPPVEDMACQPFESRNITAIKPEFCSLACVQSQRCEATIYDKKSEVCMLMKNPCFSLEHRFNHVYRSFMPECIKWVPMSGGYPVYWFLETNTQRSYVSRTAREGNIITGKKTDQFYVVSPNDNSVVIGGDYELVVVQPHCSVTWVSHDTTSSQPIPRGALIGGILTDTNTPLYVARLLTSGVVCGGYYNPLNGKAWAEFMGMNSNTVFEIMVVNV